MENIKETGAIKPEENISGNKKPNYPSYIEENQDNQDFQSYSIDKDYKSVYYFLKEHGFSEHYITNLRKQLGFILVNNTNATTITPLKKHDTLKIKINPNSKTTIMHCILPLDIVYEDAYYLLINKPSGLSTMPNKSHYSNNLAGAICYYMSKKDANFTLRIANRLDKDTAGLVLIAKSAVALKDVKVLNKKYHAICTGVIDKELIIDKPILTTQENGINIRKRTISPLGQSATTFVKPLKLLKNNLTLIELTLTHGRTHQIRVHLASINHALLGDEIYGEKSTLINHTALICKEMSFYHPYLKKTLQFTVPYPKDFISIINS